MNTVGACHPSRDTVVVASTDLARREEVQAGSINLGIIHAERFRGTKLNDSNNGVGVDRKEVQGQISGASNTKRLGTERMQSGK